MKLIKRKRIVNLASSNLASIYNEFDWCIRKLEEGISAIKFNFSND